MLNINAVERKNLENIPIFHSIKNDITKFEFENYYIVVAFAVCVAVDVDVVCKFVYRVLRVKKMPLLLREINFFRLQSCFRLQKEI